MFAGIYGESTFRACKNDREIVFPRLQCFPIMFTSVSLNRLWGLPITFTILPITIKDFPCNFIVVSLCIVFPYHFYKYEMYFPRKSLQTFAVLVYDSFVPSAKQPSVLYCRLTDFLSPE